MSFAENYRRIFLEEGLDAYATDELALKFERLTRMLLSINACTNLTAITEEEKILRKHYADCLKSAHLLPYGASVLDVGCGGGFPALPLAIARPDLTVVGLDSTGKKLQFVEICAKELNLRVQTLSGRAEELGREERYRESFDAVTARAVAALPVLCEWCLPFVRVGGVFLSMKGSGGREELKSAGNAIFRLGGKKKTVEEYTLGGAGRVNILVEKVQPTPGIYPRKNSVILKNPL